MATTTPDNLRTPNPGDPYNLVPDLATLANDVQNALNNKQSNVFKGTAAQRAAFLSTAVQGMLWQDTDGIKMLWRRDVSAWLPAVWRWAGTTAQMNGFTQAPVGFEWFNSTLGVSYLRSASSWLPGAVSWSANPSLQVISGWKALTSSSDWSAQGSSPSWDLGYVVPLTGFYSVGFSVEVAAAIPIYAAIKYNNTLNTGDGVVAKLSTTGFSGGSSCTVSRTLYATSGSRFTPAVFTSSPGSYPVTTVTTGFSVERVG